MSNLRKPTDATIERALMMLVVESREQEAAARRVVKAVEELARYRGVIRSSTAQRKSCSVPLLVRTGPVSTR